MRLSKVVLENFGPYFERHEIDLSVSSSAPLIVIHGENERGKTSFANAIRWCLYRSAQGRGHVTIPTPRLMNSQAVAIGVYNMSVQLEFEHNSSVYQLERHVQADVRPVNERDLRFHISLRKNGNFEPEASIERTLKEMLPPQIARFFLFDGEMLNEYEALLRDPTRSTIAVRQSIEQILGLPALQRAVPAFEELRRGAEKRQRQEASARRENERLIAEAQQKEEAHEALERDIAQLEEARSRLDHEREELRQRLEQFGEIQADLRELDRCDRDIHAIGEDVALATKEIQLLLRDSWWMPLERRFALESDRAQALAENASRRAASLAALQRQAHDVHAALGAAQCVVCEQPLSAAARISLERRLAVVEGEISTIEGTDADTVPHFARLSALKPFISTGAHALLTEREAAIRRSNIRRRQIESDKVAIRERVRTDYRSEIADIERQLEQCVTQRATTERLLVEATTRERETSAALQRLQAQIRALPSANRRVAAEASLYDALRALFTSGVSEFQNRLRRDVEREASAIHHELTTDSSYAGLRINEQYGLTLVSESGREILDRSAGSEQIVALSLIGALNRCATREGPIVMDTPFGRLDRGHRSNVLRYAPRLGGQVILLVQSGEVERGRDLTPIAGMIAREYCIERDGASDRSRIRLLGGDS